jgi:integrase
MAKERTLVRQRAATQKGRRKPVPKGAPDPNSGDEWWEKLFAYRDAKGMAPVRSLYNQHIKPVVPTHPNKWTKSDAERLVTELDKKIVSGAVTWKTARNGWGLFTKACKLAASAKAATGLKVRDDNPSAGVEGPERGAEKGKQWLRPDEFAQLLACPLVPLRWRRLYALLAYSYMRPSELKTLRKTAPHVDLRMGTFYVEKAWDRARKKVKSPKTEAGIRHIPIEPALLPLVKTMIAEAGDSPLLVPSMPPAEDWAETFRDHLRRAGIDRAELFVDDETHRQIRFYDLRSSGLTWRALRGDHAQAMHEASGHEDYNTTLTYVRDAQHLIGKVGEPFAPLPASLLEEFRSGNRSESTQVFGTIASPTGFEPVLQP